MIDQPLDGVGDLQLVSRAGPDGLDGVPDRVVEHVDADESQVRAGLLRLLRQADHGAVGELGDPELLGVRDLREQDLGVAADPPVLLDERGDPVGDQVVTQIHDERFPLQERFRNEHGVREAERIALLDVGELGSEPGAVAQRLPDLVFRLADDDPDAPDPGGHDGLDPVEEHRLVRDRDELLRPRVGERTQTGALAAGEDEALHRQMIPTVRHET